MLAPWKTSYDQPRQHIFREGNGTPLQYSCLENPMDGRAWWAGVYVVAQSRTQLKWLSSSSSRQHIKQQRHYFANKGSSSQSYGFPVVMDGCEIWTIKRAERWRIDVFELWCWRRLLRVPWTARRSYQSILKEISPECSWEGLMLKLKLQYFGHLMQRINSLEIDPDAGKDWR